jgi:hypothetical protein
MSGDLKYGTHWEDCEIVHHGCALAKLKQEREAFTTYRADVKPVPPRTGPYQLPHGRG